MIVHDNAVPQPPAKRLLAPDRLLCTPTTDEAHDMSSTILSAVGAVVGEADQESGSHKVNRLRLLVQFIVQVYTRTP